MPLFESQGQRNKRISGEVIHLVFEQIGESVPQPALQLAYKSMLTGAVSLALSLIQGDGVIKRLWGKGDRAKLLQLVAVSAVPMVSMFFERSGQQPHALSDAARASRENAAFNMLSMCACDSDPWVAKASKMLTQFDYERFKERGGEHGDAKGLFLYYGMLLLAMTQEAWTTRALMDWDAMSFPVRVFADLRFVPPADMASVVGSEGAGLPNLMLCTTSIPLAGAAMFAMFDKLNAGGVS